MREPLSQNITKNHRKKGPQFASQETRKWKNETKNERKDEEIRSKHQRIIESPKLYITYLNHLTKC